MDRNEKNTKTAEIFAGGGEMGERMRQFDWTTSPLGAPETWSQALKTSVDICLNSRFPMVVWWGRELVLLYNDGWRPILGANKDKIALGNRGETVWAEIWDVLKPMFDQVLDEGRATWSDDGLLLVNRYGYTEEAYFTWSYSPIRDDDGSIGGVFTAVTETTERFVGERRLKSLRDLGERTLEEARTAEDACRAAAETLAENAFDIPFALVYLLDAGGKRAFLAENLRIEKDTPAAPRVLEIGAETDIWQFNQVLDERSGKLIGKLESRFEQKFSAGAWRDDFARSAFVLPLAKAGIQDHPAGFLVAGISPRLKFNTEYRGFLELVGGQIATAIANARAYEEEKRRAEVLAELDRAKTEFFSNVSHEFRTPLTLMLGNLEEVLRKDGGEISSVEIERIETAHRNSLRLLKLVNTLLDFSSIEANRRQINFELTDLSRLTADLAGNFRSAIEKAGLRLTVDCPPLSEEIPIDREMWEKIVLNLVSNAFKFTFDGEIKVSLAETEDAVRLKVSDTGVGIPAEDLPRVFDRFHRVRSTQGRTHEGTGIGLALVRELVKMHVGEISVESQIGQGTTFTVSVPRSEPPASAGGQRVSFESFADDVPHRANPPADAGGSDRTTAAVFLQELNAFEKEVEAKSEIQNPKSKILLADDNADMREYVRRLLAENGYAVTAVADGQAALESLENEKPDLILSDVMMPNLDGFGLLEKIRADAALREIPFILLSARAGEESKVEGLDAGADDYLVKPFAARELVARVDANLKMARLRRESAENLRRTRARLESALKAGLAGTFYWDIAKDRIITDENMRRYFSLSEAATGEGVPLAEALPGVYDADRPKVEAAITEAIEKTGVYQAEYRVRHSDGKMRWLSARGTIERDANGNAVGMSGFAVDTTERNRAEEALRESEERLRLATQTAKMYSWEFDIQTQKGKMAKNSAQVLGISPEFMPKTLEEARALIHPEDRKASIRKSEAAITGNGVYSDEFRLLHPETNQIIWLEAHGTVIYDENKKPTRFVGITQNITERKEIEENLRESEERYRIVAETASDAIFTIDDQSVILFVNHAAEKIFGYKMEEMLGQPLTMLMPESLRDLHRAGFARYLATGKRHVNWEGIEVPGRRSDGSEFALEVSFGEFTKQNHKIFVGIARDITDRKAAEKTLRESEEQLRTLADSIPQLAWMAQPDGFIFWYNRKWYEYTGTMPKAMEGWGWQSVHDPEILPKVVERWKNSIETGEPFEMEFPLRGADGKFRWFLTRVNPLRDGEGRIVRWFGTNTDIEELRQARLQAEQANRLKDEFLATVSHELRTPLNAILGWSAMLQSRNVGEEIRQRADETIYRCAQSQAQLIEDLLDVSRIITGNLRIQPVPVNLASIVETAVETLRPAAVAKSIRIEMNLECEPCLINGDAQRLQQIVWNLVSNAVKFTPEAGKIEIRLENENSRARLIVSDTGKGIEPEFLPFLFERFRQEDGSSTRRHGGLGLGLAIVRHLVELHGGWISARSDGDGKGATFIVELPLLAPIQSKKTSNRKRRNLRESLSDGLMSATDAPPRLEGVRVLLVDDEKDTLELLDTALTAEGAEVRAATSAAEAFEIFRKWQPDAIVSDIAMPDEDGYSLIRRIRQLAPEKGGATPAIAMTAYVRVEDRLRVLQSGFQMYVPKPAEPFEVVTAVSNAAGQTRLP